MALRTRTAETNLARRMLVLSYLIRAEEWDDDPALSWFRTGAPHQELNQVLRCSPDAVERSIDLMSGVPALWTVWPDREDGAAVERALLRNGLVLLDEEPVLVLDLEASDTIVAQHDCVRVDAALTPDDLLEWVTLWTSGTSDPKTTKRIVRSLATFGLPDCDTPAGPPVRHLLARSTDPAQLGRVLGVASVVTVEGVAAIEHVVVVPDAEGAGVGEVLTRSAVQWAQDSGAQHAILTPDPAQRESYEALGFVQYDRVRRYTVPHESP